MSLKNWRNREDLPRIITYCSRYSQIIVIRKMILNGYQDFKLVVFFTRYTSFPSSLSIFFNESCHFVPLCGTSMQITREKILLVNNELIFRFFAMYFYKATTMYINQLCDTVNNDTFPDVSLCV